MCIISRTFRHVSKFTWWNGDGLLILKGVLMSLTQLPSCWCTWPSSQFSIVKICLTWERVTMGISSLTEHLRLCCQSISFVFLRTYYYLITIFDNSKWVRPLRNFTSQDRTMIVLGTNKITYAYDKSFFYGFVTMQAWAKLG